ncbi:hypothetical protein DL89DRAFT_257279 [Linderina pennispora]|uniref:DUF4211 domain-containing protein n=1 Tax=Linderina pennispora TaxID=61395 RepID=A0A1Y1W9J8_9FUNG|nr:uncharacterized protein DL89DRAFT_257279 [Linderina pennispora]ORX69988.1 hypothetical protein DL89DRAFT_257279 [Linderina pennispora]
MANKRRKTGRIPDKAAVVMATEPDTDEWGPPRDEIGATLTQVLRRSQRTPKKGTPVKKTTASMAAPRRQKARVVRPPIPPGDQVGTRSMERRPKQPEVLDSDIRGSIEVMVEKAKPADTSGPADSLEPDSRQKDLAIVNSDVEQQGTPTPDQQKALPQDTEAPEPDSRHQEETETRSLQGVDGVAAMFDEDEPTISDRSGAAAEKTVAEHTTISVDDDSIDAEPPKSPAPKSQAMTNINNDTDDLDNDDVFMDQESAQNYRRLMAKERRKRRASRLAQRTAQNPVPRRVVGIPQSNISSFSEEDMPADPLNAPSSLRKTRARSQRLLISDSEDTGGEDPSDILDSQAVLSRRLRPKGEAANRFELAQQKMHEISYDTESDDNGVDSIGEFESQERVAVDAVESDSDINTKRVARALIIHDTSDEEDDFVLEPEEEAAPAVPPQNIDKVNKFLGMFESRRRKQMQSRLQQSTTRRQAGAWSRPKASFGALGEEIIDDSDDDADLADFIVDDDDGDDINANEHAARVTLDDRVRDAVAQMPEEFSQLDLPTSFKTYVQYLVHWICNGRKAPGFSDDESRYFFLGYVTVNRALETLEQSLVSSTAWLDSFRDDLSSYPNIAVSRIAGVPGCEACHFRDNRTATFCIMFSGTPYQRDILVPPNRAVPNDGSVVSIDSEEEVEGRPVEYNVGRVCKSRAQLYHELHHYFYSLSYMVEADLAQLAIGDDRDAEELVVLLEQRRCIERHYFGFKELLERSKHGFAS